MIVFYEEIALDDDVAHWYINQAEDREENLFDLFEIVLTEYYQNKELEE